MKRALARQAEAERERRAKVIAAEGELQAAAKLTEAAEVIGRYPAAMQLRLYQTLSEISSEPAAKIVLPIPIELMAGLSQRGGLTAEQVTAIVQQVMTSASTAPVKITQGEPVRPIAAAAPATKPRATGGE